MKNKLIKAAAILSAVVLVLGIAGCASGGGSKYAGQTILGKVVAVNGTSVTLELGEVDEENIDEANEQGAKASEQPSDKDASGQSSNATQQGEPPAKPEGNTASNDSDATQQGEPPAKPDGDTGSNNAAGGNSGTTQQGEPPAKPDGDTGGMPQGGEPGGNGGGMPQMALPTFEANGETATIDLGSAMPDGLKEGDIIEVSFGSDGKAENVSTLNLGGAGGGEPGAGGGFGGSGNVTQGTAATNIDSDTNIEGETFTSSGDDENALRVTGASVMMDSIVVDKSGGASSNTEDGDFYGMNAAFLATDGAHVAISNSTIESNAQNGNGVFSYGEDTLVDISDCTITTKADNSGGIQTTGGATTNATNLTVDTSGNSAAAIRSDRGGGVVLVNGGSYTSHGLNSPAVYSTANITVSDATLTATDSEALVIEGKNSIALESCTVEGTMNPTEGTASSENVHNVMIYQSMSGDAEVGSSSFEMNGGILKANTGDMFYLTNTHATVSLASVKLVPSSDGALMRVVGNSASHGWGNAGANGAQCELMASCQELVGDIIVDSISTLELTLSSGSTFEGTINIVDNEQGGAAVADNATVVIGDSCTWKLTGDCKISTLENLGSIDFNGFTITLADDTVLK